MKVASLSPSLTETLVALDAASHLVLVTQQCPDFQDPLARVESSKSFDLAVIEAARPDLILVDASEITDENRKALERVAQVMAFEVRSIQHVLDMVWDLGRKFGKMELAQNLKASIVRERADNQACFQGREPLDALVLLWNRPHITVNFDTYLSRMLEECGMRNVFHAEAVREFPVDIETMIKQNPSVLLLAGEPFSFKKRHIKPFREFKVFSKIPIELVDGRWFAHYGPRTAQALKFFRELTLRLTRTAPDVQKIEVSP